MKVGICGHTDCKRVHFAERKLEVTYRTDTDLRCDLFHFVDVDLVVVGTRELGRKLLKDGRDEPARAAPRRREVENGDAFAVDL